MMVAGRMQEAQQRARHVLAPAAFGESPGGEHHEGRLHEFGRLHAERTDHHPAMRALDLRSVLERQQDEDHADEIDRRAPGAADGAATGTTPTSRIAKAGMRNMTCRFTKWNVERPRRSATGGPPAMRKTRPARTRMASAASSDRSTVHHQSPNAERSARDTMALKLPSPVRCRARPGPARGSDFRELRNSDIDRRTRRPATAARRLRPFRRRPCGLLRRPRRACRNERAAPHRRASAANSSDAAPIR